MISRRKVLMVWAAGLTVFFVMYLNLPYITPDSRNGTRKTTAPSELGLPSSERENTHTTTGSVKETVVPAMPTVNANVVVLQPKFCSPDKSLLVGPVYINKTVPEMKEVIEELSVEFGGFVEKGGASRPKNCFAKHKLAIVVPYRNRSEHLRVFLRHMHPIMERQGHDYRIIVVEQAGNSSFNRATLLNIGFLEALKIGNFECFVFHDVDHILENDRNDYGCPEVPTLLGVSVDRFHRRFPYLHYFGGVASFTKEHFEKINGYSNKFWGWGGEDDDAYNRVRAAGYSLRRRPANIGRYIMLQEHHVRAEVGKDRHELLKTSAERMYEDGLNTVRYTMEEKKEYPLYTFISVNISEEHDKTPTTWTQRPTFA